MSSLDQLGPTLRKAGQRCPLTPVGIPRPDFLQDRDSSMCASDTDGATEHPCYCVCSRPVLDFEIEFLQEVQPPFGLTYRLLRPSEPLQGLVVCTDRKMSSQKILFKHLQSQRHG